MNTSSVVPSEKYQRLISEVEQLRRINTELAREKEELLQEGKTSIHKYEANIYEIKPADPKVLQRQRDLEFQLSQAENELKKCIFELNSLRTRVATIPDLEYNLTALQNDNVRLSNELSETLRELDILKKERSDFTQKNRLIIEERTRETESFRIKIKELEVQLSQHMNDKRNMDILTSDIERVSALLIQRDQEIEGFRRTIKQLEADKHQFLQSRGELDRMRLELEELKGLLITVTKERDGFVGTIEIREREITELNQELSRVAGDAQERSMLIQEIESLRAKIAVLQRDLEGRDMRIEEFTVIIREQKSREPELLRSLELMTRERDSLLLQLNEMKQQLDPLMRERESFMMVSRNKEVQIVELTQSLGRISPELDQARARIFALENELKTLGFTLANEQKDREALTNRILELEGFVFELEKLKVLIAKITQERDGLLQTLTMRDNQVLTLQKEFDRVKGELHRRISEFEIMKQKFVDVEELQQEMRARDVIISDLYVSQNAWETKEKQLLMSIQAFDGEKSRLIAELEALQVELGQLIPERDNILRLLKQKDSQIVALNADFNRISIDNKELIRVIGELEKGRNSFNTIIRERDVEIDRLSKRLNQIILELDDLKNKIKFFDPENKRLSLLVKEQEKELLMLRGQVHEFSHLESRIKELTMINSQLRGQIEPMDKMKMELAHLHQQVDDLVLKRDQMFVLLEEREAELNGLSPLLKDYELMKNRYGESKREIERLSAALTQGQSYIRELEVLIGNLQEKERAQKGLIAENGMLRQESSMLRQKIKDLELSLTVISNKYRHIESLYLDIREATEHLGMAQEKLVEACDIAERVEPSMRSVVSQKSTFIEKSGHQNWNMSQQSFETPQRF